VPLCIGRLHEDCGRQTLRSIPELPVASGASYSVNMTTFLYRCPSTGYRVQGFVVDEVTGDADDAFKSVQCLVCQRIHLVKAETGEVLGETDD
jgi:hypothetical protein